jgi:hyperosmotically inducible periplasmic protein
VPRSRKHRRDLALLTAVAVLKNAAAGQTQATALHVDDSTITLKVATALHDELLPGATGLVVATEDRVVRLTGTACSQAHVDNAAKVARAIGGVQSVRNDLRLMPH